MREIKFRAEYNNRTYEVETRLPKRKNSKGIYTTQGYVKRLVTEHPFTDKRGYVGEHRLVVEASLGRFLLPTEFIHHIDQNRGNNEITNLKLLGASDHAMEHLKGIRNPNGRFIASEPIFADIKFRLHDKDRNITAIYTLQELIATTYRRGKFEFRGRFTGLKDKNGKEVYEGDVVETSGYITIVVYKENRFTCMYDLGNAEEMDFDVFRDIEVIGNIYENPELLSSDNK